MKRVAALGAPVIGINNRDLTTFKVSLDTTYQLLEHAPADAFLISESGIKTADDVAKLHAAGIRGILVGEHLLKQGKVKTAVQTLMSKVWVTS
jgi:indole-3-glycerol phosphate synthase